MAKPKAPKTSKTPIAITNKLSVADPASSAPVVGKVLGVPMAVADGVVAADEVEVATDVAVDSVVAVAAGVAV